MALVILLRVPDEFQNFSRSKKKKKAFHNIAKNSGNIPDVFVKQVIEVTKEFDEKYRTDEAHGSGRSWRYSYLDQSNADVQANMFWAYNELNGLMAILGTAFRQQSHNN